jgi:hypothetical protein
LYFYSFIQQILVSYYISATILGVRNITENIRGNGMEAKGTVLLLGIGH